MCSQQRKERSYIQATTVHTHRCYHASCIIRYAGAGGQEPGCEIGYLCLDYLSERCLWLLLNRHDVALATVSPPVIIVLYGSVPRAAGEFTQLPWLVVVHPLAFLNPRVNPACTYKMGGC